MNNKTTYALLMQSEEKGRDILETSVYAVCILSAVFAIWQFAQQPVSLPLNQIILSQQPSLERVGCDRA